MRNALFMVMLIGLAGCDAADRANSTMGANTRPSAPSTQARAEDRRILVDAAHAVRESQLYGKPYLLSAGTLLTLDGTRFTFQDPRHLGRLPNAVQVLYDRSEYMMDWPMGNARRAVQLDASSMKVLAGNPFDGFASGKRAFVAVGYRTPGSGTSDKTAFTPFWVGLVIFH